MYAYILEGSNIQQRNRWLKPAMFLASSTTDMEIIVLTYAYFYIGFILQLWQCILYNAYSTITISSY